MPHDDLIYGAVQLSAGWVAFAATPRGLARQTLPHATEREALQTLGVDRIVEGRRDDPAFAPLAARLERYYRGEPEGFDDVALDLSESTPFQRQVLEAVRAIPRGQVRSYGQVAAGVGRPGAARAVGATMASNPVCVIIPCHRVIGSDGALAGFGGGLDLKRRMLAIEGVEETGRSPVSSARP